MIIATVWVVISLTATAHANITYTVNRIIDQGTVTGFIETDGTIGVLSTANIIDWELTLIAPNLLGGSPYVIDRATQTQTTLNGVVTTATETDILFDMSGGSGVGYFLLHGGGVETNFWCVETANAFCTTEGIGEHIGYDDAGGITAQTSFPTGVFSIASVRIPCPADVTEDDNLDFFDISAFLAAYSASDPVADFTGDGAIDFFDISAFLTAFSLGCP